MDDLEIKRYKDAVTNALKIWEDESKQVGKDLAALNAELEKLNQSKPPGPADRIKALEKKREALYGRMNNASDELRLNLMLITPPVKAPEKELIKLPDWLKDIIKRKGIHLGKGVVITPKIDFDFKARKIKSFGITIKW